METKLTLTRQKRLNLHPHTVAYHELHQSQKIHNPEEYPRNQHSRKHR